MAVTQAGLLELNSAAVPAPAGRAAEKAARGQREKWLRSEIYARWAKKGLLRALDTAVRRQKIEAFRLFF